MSEPTKDQLKSFLYTLITPDTDAEKEKFKDSIDDFIALSNRMEQMTRDELLSEINNQLKPYNLKVDEGF